ncbi:MAG: isochorismatase family protein [Acidiferrobacteraceae bacterium]
MPSSRLKDPGLGGDVPALLDADGSVLLLVDLQGRLLEAMPAGRQPALHRRLGILATTAGHLGVPVIATRQSVQRLGPLDADLAKALPADTPVFDKTSFSCAPVPGILQAIGDRRSVVIGGVEAHICVLQTAFDLTTLGFSVSVVADAICSRFDTDSEHALHRLRQAHIGLPTTESVVYEWLRDASHPRFRDVLALVR